MNRATYECTVLAGMLSVGIISALLIDHFLSPEDQVEIVEDQVEAAPFHGNFVCEYYGAKTQQIEQVVKYNVFDLGNNLGWSLTLADGAQLMYVQSADKFCYTVPTAVKVK